MWYFCRIGPFFLMYLFLIRKRKIEAELVMNTSYYVTDIHSIQVAVIQKRSNLIDAVKKAKELKTTHSLESCHSLNQVS